MYSRNDEDKSVETRFNKINAHLLCMLMLEIILAR